MKRLSFLKPGTQIRYISDQTETVIEGRVTFIKVQFGVEGELAICIETGKHEPYRALPATTWVAVEGDDDYDTKPPTMSLWLLDRGTDVIEPRELLACIVAASTEHEARGVAADHAEGEGVNAWYGGTNLVTVSQLSGTDISEPRMILPNYAVAD
ncbi:hypothetical protein ACIA49_39110 [Kribbella sp. NPDC051587]|uniref:hypothetical protein n=1 Tax=Kribbella sp. NPDC051587 TaxID=3364119 RepID=UPI0037A0223D